MAIGSDIMMVLDQCVPSTADRAVGAGRARPHASLGGTQPGRARRFAAVDVRHRPGRALPGPAPRERRWPRGHAVRRPRHRRPGGGRGAGRARRTCASTPRRMLPRDRPRYLMGVGTPLDLLEAVHRGVDMFDCIIPTPLAQRGGVFTSRGYLQLRRGVHKFADDRPRPEVRLPDLRALLARLPAPPHEDRRAAGLAPARPAQPLLLPPAHARDPREHPRRHVPSPLRARGA